MLQALITSKTRIRLLLKFFLNSRNTSYLRDLASELGESTNAIRMELNHLEQAGLLNARMQGNKKVFQANSEHPLFSSIQELLMKHTGIDRVVEHVVRKLGGLQRAYLVGSFARGKDNPVVDLLLAGNNIDTGYLVHLIEKAEGMIDRKIRYVIVDPREVDQYLAVYPEALILWECG